MDEDEDDQTKDFSDSDSEDEQSTSNHAQRVSKAKNTVVPEFEQIEDSIETTDLPSSTPKHNLKDNHRKKRSSKKKKGRFRVKHHKANKMFNSHLSRGSKLYKFMKFEYLREEDDENMEELTYQLK